jgi:hypothetical protein
MVRLSRSTGDRVDDVAMAWRATAGMHSTTSPHLPAAILQAEPDQRGIDRAATADQPEKMLPASRSSSPV